jgi:hypothetical protein
MCCYGWNSVTRPAIAILYQPALRTTSSRLRRSAQLNVGDPTRIGNIKNMKLIQGEQGPLRQTLRSERSRREDHILSSDASIRSYAPLFAACRTGTCTQPVHFKSVYVYNVEPSDDAVSSQSVTLATACNHPSRMDVFDLRGQRVHPT